MSDQKYTDEQTDIMFNLHFRDEPRPMPWLMITEAMRVVMTEQAFDRYLWGRITGYGSLVDPKGDPKGPRYRRTYTPTKNGRVPRVGHKWQDREKDWLYKILRDEGQERAPRCDYRHAAAILARSAAEVEEQWLMQVDPTGRGGFGLK